MSMAQKQRILKEELDAAIAEIPSATIISSGPEKLYVVKVEVNLPKSMPAILCPRLGAE